MSVFSFVEYFICNKFLVKNTFQIFCSAPNSPTYLTAVDCEAHVVEELLFEEIFQLRPVNHLALKLSRHVQDLGHSVTQVKHKDIF